MNNNERFPGQITVTGYVKVNGLGAEIITMTVTKEQLENILDKLEEMDGDEVLVIANVPPEDRDSAPAYIRPVAA